MITRRHALGLMGVASTCLPGIVRAQGKDEPAAPAVTGLPRNPRIIDLPAMGRETGHSGGRARILIGGQRDVRLIPIYSYSRLMGYGPDRQLSPDILSACDVEDERVFTMHLREDHRWSNGAPFTAEDFRYAWEDVLNNTDLYKNGLPVELIANGKPATFEVLDELTVRYSFAGPMPGFLPRLAAPLPLVLFMPFGYLRQFHSRYQSVEVLERLAAEQKVDDWRRLHMKMSRSIRPENPDLPTLEAWRPRTAPPAEQFVFERNPYFHRADQSGQQLPYIDRIELNVASSEIIMAKTATGESDLQLDGLTFGDYTMLKQAEKSRPLRVSLWKKTQGSAVALMPNLNCKDDVWRGLFRDVRMRRALSVAIDRVEINKVIFFGLGRESADTILPDSALFRPELATAWAQYDPDLANRLLDEIGLTERGGGGIRKLPDGRQAGIIVEGAGEAAMETDVLELIRDHFREVGIALYIHASQRDVFRSRALAGDVLMAVWQGLDNGVPTADMSPDELAPTSGDQLQWPLWGTWYASAGDAGTEPDLPEAEQLLKLLREWEGSTLADRRAEIWAEMLALRADQVFSIGTVNSALHPVVRAAKMRNLPEKGLYGFEPTSYLGAYMPDTFFYEEG